MRVIYGTVLERVKVREFTDAVSMWKFVKVRLFVRKAIDEIDDTFLFSVVKSRALRRPKRRRARAKLIAPRAISLPPTQR